jgi:hypothetical protein
LLYLRLEPVHKILQIQIVFTLVKDGITAWKTKLAINVPIIPMLNKFQWIALLGVPTSVAPWNLRLLATVSLDALIIMKGIMKSGIAMSLMSQREINVCDIIRTATVIATLWNATGNLKLLGICGNTIMSRPSASQEMLVPRDSSLSLNGIKQIITKS